MNSLTTRTKIIFVSILLLSVFVLFIFGLGIKSDRARLIAMHALVPQVLLSADISYPSPYDASKISNFRLQDGTNQQKDSTGRLVTHEVAGTAIGDLDGDRIAEGVIGLMERYGKKKIPLLFLFKNDRGRAVQIDAVVLDSSPVRDLISIRSLAIADRVLQVELTVGGAGNATSSKLLLFKSVEGKLVRIP